MKVSEIMSRNVKTVSPEDSISKAVAVMEKSNLKELPIVEGEKFIGVIDMQNIIKSIKASPEMKVRRKMSVYPTAKPDTDVNECIRLMVGSGTEFIPVIEKGKVVGVVSDYDLLKSNEGIAGVVSGFMRTNVPVCSPDDNIGTARKIMESSGVNRLAVSENGVCSGMIILIDILRKVYIERQKGQNISRSGEMSKIMSFPVSGVMRTLKNKVYPNTELSKALEMMLSQNLRGVPVVNMKDQPVGLLLRKDVLTMLLPQEERGIVVDISGSGRFERDDIIRYVEARLQRGYFYRGFRGIKVRVKQIHESSGSEGKYEIAVSFVGDRPLRMKRTGFMVGDTLNDLMDDAERVLNQQTF